MKNVNIEVTNNRLALASHVKDVVELAKNNRLPAEMLAKKAGISVHALHSYMKNPDTDSFRMITPVMLDKIRDLAVDAYWSAAIVPYKFMRATDFAATKFVLDYYVPTWHVNNHRGEPIYSHPHPLRAQEVADKNGGKIAYGTQNTSTSMIGTRTVVPFRILGIEKVRSDFRKAVYSLRVQMTETDNFHEIVSQILECDPYDVWRYLTEYEPWMLQPKFELIAAVQSFKLSTLGEAA